MNSADATRKPTTVRDGPGLRPEARNALMLKLRTGRGHFRPPGSRDHRGGAQRHLSRTGRGPCQAEDARSGNPGAPKQAILEHFMNR
jgi:hypothetical protein